MSFLSKRDFSKNYGTSQLAPREKAVAECLARGEPNKTLAQTLGISEHTASAHTRHIFEKIGVETRHAAAMHFDYDPPGPNPFLNAAILINRREGNLLTWLTAGKNNQELSLICEISEDSVRNRLKIIYDKTGLKDRTAVALYWRQLLKMMASDTRAEADPQPEPRRPLEASRAVLRPFSV